MTVPAVQVAMRRPLGLAAVPLKMLLAVIALVVSPAYGEADRASIVIEAKCNGGGCCSLRSRSESVVALRA